MGNAANKEVDNTPVEDGPFTASTAISSALLSSSSSTIKNKGTRWCDAEGKVLWKTEAKGRIKSHGILTDGEGTVIAITITQKSGITTLNSYICKSTPSFGGQEPLTGEALKKAGIAEGTTLYKFSKIETSRTLTTAKAEYSLVGKGGEEVVFTAAKLSAMNFLALFKSGDTVFAKAYVKGISVHPVVECGAGVDFLAVTCVGYSLLGDPSGVGALAGAGVI